MDLRIIQAEQIIVAEMLYNPDMCDWEFLFNKVKGPDYFTQDPIAGRVYTVCKKMIDKDEKVCLSSIRLELPQVTIMDTVAYTEYVTDISTFRKACVKLQVAYFNRTVNRITKEETAKIEQLEDPGDTELLDASNEIIFRVSDLTDTGVIKNDVHNLGDYSINYMQYLDDLKSGKIDTGLKTGIKSLDTKIIGMKPAQYIVLAAMESMGKSSLALNIINENLKAGKSILYFSLEMTERQVLNRLVSIRNGIPMNLLNNADEIPKQMYEVIGKTLTEISSQKLFISVSMDINMSSILQQAKKIQKKHGLDLLVIDHIHLLPQNESDESKIRIIVQQISREIKKTAKVLNIPVLAVAQLRRQESDPYMQKLPSRKLLAESSALEKDADVIILLHRYQKDEDGTPANLQKQQDLTIIVDKNRDGAIGQVYAHYDLSNQRITDNNNLCPNEVNI